MPRLLLHVILFLTSLSSLAKKPDFVLELCRHGARAPLSSDYDQSWPIDTLGDLTPVGMRQHYILGDAIYRQYPYFFESPQYNDSVYILSDVVQRCIQSASSQFFGVFLDQGPSLPKDYPPGRAVPPYNSPFINKTARGLNNSEVFPVRFYPTLINYVSTPAETIMFESDSSSVCPIVSLWYNENFADEKAQQAWETFQPLIQYLNSFGVNLTTAQEFVSFGDTFFCDYYDNRALPFGIPYTDDLVVNMSFAFGWWQAHVWEGQPIQQQSNAYGFANAFINYLQSYLNGSQPAQFILLSGHDDNIHTLLTPLGIVYDDCVMENFLSYWANGRTPHPNCHFPWFASTLKYELYNESTPYIKFYYEDNLIPLCDGSDCTVVEFIELMQNITGNVTFEQWNATCNFITPNQTISNEKEDTSKISNENRSVLESFTIDGKDIVIAALALICVSLGVVLIFERKKHHQEIERSRTTLLF